VTEKVKRLAAVNCAETEESVIFSLLSCFKKIE
jgi:hypothetical protein